MSNPTGDTQSFEDAVLAWQEKYVVRINRPNSQHDALDELLAAHTAAVRAELEALLADFEAWDKDNLLWANSALLAVSDRIALTNPQEGR